MLAFMQEFEPWWRFAVALLIGALIGLEREFIQQRSGEGQFAGLRTFGLIGLLGAVAAFLTSELGPLPALVAYAGIILLVVGSYVTGNLREDDQEGITTEVTVLLTFLLGGMVFWSRVELAVALGVVTAVILSFKFEFHTLVRRMSREDVRAMLQFALVALVILPILPDRALDPLGVLNPFRIWLLVVFISGIGFVGYILMKVLGAEKGIGLTGVLGGLVSSTATTMSFSTRSKQNEGFSAHYALAIVVASCVMFPRVAIEALVVHPPMLDIILMPLAAMLLAGLLAAVVLWRTGQQETETNQEAIELNNPLRLGSAIVFALVFALVLVVVRVADEWFSTAGVYIAALITGLTDVDAITLSTSQLAQRGQMAEEVAGGAVVIAALVNTAAKGVIAYTAGSAYLRRAVALAFGFVLVVGVVSGLIFVWL